MRINMNLNNRNNDLRSDTNKNNISFLLKGTPTLVAEFATLKWK